jgi:hypothetical protein
MSTKYIIISIYLYFKKKKFLGYYKNVSVIYAVCDYLIDYLKKCVPFSLYYFLYKEKIANSFVLFQEKKCQAQEEEATEMMT